MQKNPEKSGFGFYLQLRNYNPLYFLSVVKGVSMVPTLAPGDKVVVRRLHTPSKRIVGRIVVAKDPRAGGVLVIKRLVGFDRNSFELLGDNLGASTDSRTIGRFPNNSLMGVVVYRYFPPSAAGRVW